MTREITRVEEILKKACASHAGKAALVDPHGSCSYAELADAAQLVAALLARHNVPAGSLIGIAVRDARSFLASLFGVLETGCVAIPISPQLPTHEQQRVIRDTGVSFVITQGAELSGAQLITTYAGPLLTEGMTLLRTTPLLSTKLSALFPDAALMRHTSGTTGRSKGVVLSHRAVIERTEVCSNLLDVSSNDTVLAPLPLAYHFVASALSFVRAGATIVDCSLLSVAEILPFARRYATSHIYASPIQYEFLSRSGAGDELPNLRWAFSTSALLPLSVASAFEQRFGRRLTQVYGIIEVGLPLWNTEEGWNPSALGRCIPPYECRIVDAHQNEVPLGESGELLVRGPGLFSGYLCGDTTPTPSMRDGWFATGDLVARDETGCIWYRGRSKSVINCAGNKVFPEEVEEVIRTVPGISEARVSGEPHPLLGSLVIAEVVLDSNTECDLEEVRSRCFRTLAPFKVPKEFRVVDSLELTGSGKVVRGG